MNFKKLLETQEHVFGVFAKTSDPFFIEILGLSKFDFVILDSEHGPNTYREMYPLILACQNNNIHPIVRVGKLDDIEIQKYLDLGLSGIQIPQVNTKKDAESVKKYTKFFPNGMRGVCRYVRPADFSLKDKSEYFKEQNELVNIIHIEGETGINNLDEIINVENIDIVFIGPYDLSQSLGIPGEMSNPKLTDKITEIVNKCKLKNKFVGIFTEDINQVKKYKQMGIKYIAFSVDVGLFANICKKTVFDLKNI